ncbi:hypothetical protein [Haloactinospora alba]|uniref:hypothetical protein n=1 Tax=Haloactinospora alba TaxID=405555 RepID=UPI001B877FBD|nr:hypothetical protein [Haloactinospora alba]
MENSTPWLAGGIASIGAILAVFVAPAIADSTEAQAPATESSSAGYVVEDFDYPQAAKIEEERGITLKRGDGHIVLADCGSQEDLLEVWARDNKQSKYCFRVTGDSGWLTLELPAVYGVANADYDTSLDMTVDGQHKQFDVAPNEQKGVGESADPDDREHLLVKITSTK